MIDDLGKRSTITTNCLYHIKNYCSVYLLRHFSYAISLFTFKSFSNRFFCLEKYISLFMFVLSMYFYVFICNNGAKQHPQCIRAKNSSSFDSSFIIFVAGKWNLCIIFDIDALYSLLRINLSDDSLQIAVKMRKQRNEKMKPVKVFTPL